ncbi:SDR family NAD(P)-dependent oxidoreductase [uncultured Thiothrix sp.]|uniref:SDR family NAD(P)-dependent oxidoreductase n=1 Tax=uncultured Thiothrix sp. TaxID=223185 RepID=UPI00262832E3|nr:SDR family NAD(P)-dependent oxidoreductase [uncultured Thiothrix sp.]
MQKTAVITGANRGLGFGAAQALAAQGYQVFMLGRNPEQIAQAASQVPQAIGLAVDVAKTEQVKAAAKQISQQIDHLDVLINNAGVILERDHPNLTTADPEIMLATFNINTVGALRMTQAFMPLLEKSSAPRIVNVSSGMGGLTEMGAGYPAYRLSKTALNALTTFTVAEVHNPKFKVNSVCPGWVRTAMGGSQADRSIEEAIPGILWAAQLPEDGPTGGFFRDGQRLDW